MNRTMIEALVTKHEGRRAAVYPDSKGIPTIGIGWNLEDAESALICSYYALDLAKLKSGAATLTEAQIDEVFAYQLDETIAAAMKLLPKFLAMPNVVQAVVVDMIFNMGAPAFSEFDATIAALNAGNWKLAATHAEQSLWAREVPSRAKDDVELLQTAAQLEEA